MNLEGPGVIDNHSDEEYAVEPLAEPDDQSQDEASLADNVRHSTRQQSGKLDLLLR